MSTVDLSSFPLLLIHQLNHIDTKLLNKSLVELQLKLNDEPSNSPLIPYGTKQLKATRVELAKRSAEERVERMILGLEASPPILIKPLASIPQNTTTPAPPTSSTTATNSISHKRPRPRSNNNHNNNNVHHNHNHDIQNSSNPTTTAPPSLHLPVKHTTYESSIGSARATSSRRPFPIQKETTTSTTSIKRPTSAQSITSPTNTSAPRATTAPTKDPETDEVESEYSQKSLQLQRRRKKSSNIGFGDWGKNGFAVGGGKKKNWENKIAKRERAKEKKRTAADRKMREDRKKAHTSKHIQSARDMLKIKKLRRIERSKRKKVLENYRQQVSQQVSQQQQQQQSRNQDALTEQKEDGRVIKKSVTQRRMRGEKVHETSRTKRARETNERNSEQNNSLPTSITISTTTPSAIPSTTTTSTRKSKKDSDIVSDTVLVKNSTNNFTPTTATTTVPLIIPPNIEAVGLHAVNAVNETDQVDQINQVDDSDGYDDSETDEEDMEEEELNSVALARIDQALRTIDTAQKRDDELEKQLIEDPDQYMSRIEEENEEQGNKKKKVNNLKFKNITRLNQVVENDDDGEEDEEEDEELIPTPRFDTEEDVEAVNEAKEAVHTTEYNETKDKVIDKVLQKDKDEQEEEEEEEEDEELIPTPRLQEEEEEEEEEKRISKPNKTNSILSPQKSSTKERKKTKKSIKPTGSIYGDFLMNDNNIITNNAMNHPSPTIQATTPPAPPTVSHQPPMTKPTTPTSSKIAATSKITATSITATSITTVQSSPNINHVSSLNKSLKVPITIVPVEQEQVKQVPVEQVPVKQVPVKQVPVTEVSWENVHQDDGDEEEEPPWYQQEMHQDLNSTTKNNQDDNQNNKSKILNRQIGRRAGRAGGTGGTGGTERVGGTRATLDAQTKNDTTQTKKDTAKHTTTKEITAKDTTATKKNDRSNPINPINSSKTIVQYRHPKKYNSFYINQFQQFSDIFTGMLHSDSNSNNNHINNISSRGGRSNIPKAHQPRSRRRSQNRTADEKELISYMLSSIEKWFVDLDCVVNSTQLSPRPFNNNDTGNATTSDTSETETLISNGMYYVAKQTKLRKEVIDIVTTTMKNIKQKNSKNINSTTNANSKWINVPDFVESSRGTHLWNLMWTWSRPKINYNHLLSWQRVNHFPSSRHLTRKDCLKRNFDRYTKVPGKLATNFTLMKETFCLPKEYLSFIEAFSATAEEEELKYPHRPPGSMNWWILKPAGLSRGRGITVVNDISQVTYGNDAVIQRYILDPHLLDGYKYDLRIYVLVTSFNPLEAFVYEEGFVRFSTVPYSTEPESLKNKFVHLTNSSIQKHNNASVPTAGANLDPNQKRNSGKKERPAHPADRARPDEIGGTKLKLSYLWRRFQEDGMNVQKIQKDITSVIVKTLLVADDAIPNQPNSFELYGFDVMLDQQLKPWLIEVNSSPSLACEFKVDVDVKHKMMDDTIRLIDPAQFDRNELRDVLKERLSTLEMDRKRPYATPSAMAARSVTSMANSSTAYSNGSNGNKDSSGSGFEVRLTASQKKMNEYLNRILKGHVPRVPCSGVPPKHLGGYVQVAPGGEAYDKALQLKRRCFMSHRTKGK